MNDNTNNIELYEENDTNASVTECDETATSNKKKSNAWVGKALLVLAGIGIAKGYDYFKGKREASKKKKGKVITVTECEADEPCEEGTVE